LGVGEADAVPWFNIGINIGVAAPMAYFPFTGWKDSFFGEVYEPLRNSQKAMRAVA
jgi:acyl-CoA reductase-like NAD-dependent aldehyde dehydrogenase